MKCRLFSTALAMGLLLSAGAASAFGDAQSPQTVGEILQVQHELRQNLDKPGGEYSRFSDGDIDQMKRAQDKVFQMLRGVGSLDQLNEGQKTDLSNSLDEIKSILLANKGNRLICRRERKTGTNITERHCETAAQREADARGSQNAIRELDNSRIQTQHGG